MLNQARSTSLESSPSNVSFGAPLLNLPSYYEILESSPKLSAQAIISSASSSPPRTPSDSEVAVAPVPKQTSPAAAAGKKKAHKKRKRTGRACVYCQKLHLSCDEQRPCSRCTKAGREDQCRDGKRKRRGRKRKNAPLEEELDEDDCCSDESGSGHSHSHSHSHNHHHEDFGMDDSSADNDDTVSTVSNDSSFIDKHSPLPKRAKPQNSPGFYDVVTYDDEAVEAAALLLTFHNVTTSAASRRPVRVF